MFWGLPPWRIDFTPQSHPLPAEVDVAVIGGGFTGVAAAACLRDLAPQKTVAVFEAHRLGSGASGRTGGIALAETAAGDLPSLGDVLGSFARILQRLEVDCELTLPGVWEIARSKALSHSPIAWQDSGTLRVAREVPGGTVDPGQLLGGLARAGERRGVQFFEGTPVQSVQFERIMELKLPSGEVRARQILFASNAHALRWSGLAEQAQARFTLALATEPLSAEQLEALGLAQRKAFYTLDLPYLWGRVLADNGVVFGGGLVNIRDSDALAAMDVGSGEAAEKLVSLERRVRALHPALHAVKIALRWGGPILFGNSFRPFFGWHPRSHDALVLGGFSGQGVTLSVHLGCWAAQVLLGQRHPPSWGLIVG